MLHKISLSFLKKEIEKDYYESMLKAFKTGNKVATKFLVGTFSVLLLIRICFLEREFHQIALSGGDIIIIGVLYLIQKYSKFVRMYFGVFFLSFVGVLNMELCIYAQDFKTAISV